MYGVGGFGEKVIKKKKDLGFFFQGLGLGVLYLIVFMGKYEGL